MSTAQTVSKVWSFCHTLCDDGVGYGDIKIKPEHAPFYHRCEPETYYCTGTIPIHHHILMTSVVLFFTDKLYHPYSGKYWKGSLHSLPSQDHAPSSNRKE